MKFKVGVALVALASLVFASQACNTAAYRADDPSKIRVGIVFDIGGKDDRSYQCSDGSCLADGAEGGATRKG